MKFLVVLLLVFTSSIASSQLFDGIDHLSQYQPEIGDLEQSLRSNPKKYKRIYRSLRAQQKLKNDKTLEAALDVFHGSYFYFINKMDSSSHYFDLALKTSKEIGNDQIYRTAKIRKIFTDEYKKTKYQMTEEMKSVYVESYNQKDTINLLYSLNGLGLFYQDMDSMALAMNIFYEALRIAELSDNKNELGFIHNNLGLLKYDLGARDSAFSDFKQCLKIGEELNNVSLQAIARQNMGLYYSRIDSIKLAKEQYYIVNKMGREFGYPLYWLSSTTNLATLEMQEGNRVAGDSLSDLALKIAKEGQILHSVTQIYFGRTYNNMQKGQYHQALIELDSAFAYSKYAPYSEVMVPYYHLKYRIYEEMKDYENAFHFYQQKVALQDSLNELGNDKLLAELQFRYDDEKKNRIRSAREAKLKIELKEGEVEMAKFRQRVIILIAGILVVLFFIIIMYFRLKQKSDNLFSFTIANKLEEERGRIARDLHDGLGQSMAVLKNKFNNLDPNDQEGTLALDKEFSNVIEEVRSISRSLIPPELRRLGLKQALNVMLEDVEKSTGKIVTTDLDALDRVKFEDHQSIRLYRIVQELCTNTIKHSGASSIKFEAILDEDELICIYQDNGKGLDLDKWRSADNSVGFKSIQQRLKYLKGSIKVLKPKTGFKVELKIPQSS